MSDYASQLPIRTENPGDVASKIVDALVPSQGMTVNPDGSINTITTATDLDIRDLSHTQDSVKVGDGTDFLAINADGSVNITDNGGSLTVDATDLDIRDLSAAQDNVAISDGTDTLEINADGSINSVVTATDLDIRDLSHTQDSVKIGDGTDFLAVNADGSLNAVVTATDLDVRDLSAATDSVSAWLKDENGVAFSSANPLPVVVLESEGAEINDYNTSAAVAAAASSNHDYTVTAGKTLVLTQVRATGSGRAKMEVQIETGVATNTFVTRFVSFNSTATPDMEVVLKEPINVLAGVRVRVIRTNRDNQAQDLYSTISGHEV